LGRRLLRVFLAAPFRSLQKAHELKKLAIVGSGANTRDAAPWDDLSYQIWVFNEAGSAPWCKRWDAVFQMHKPDIYRGHNTKDPRHWEWLQQSHGKPIYMQEVDPLVPDSVRFPIEEARALTGFNYFAATFAYMAALAKLQGYEQVDIHGIELSFTEYQYQAECWRFWVGYLMGCMKVNVYSGLKLFEAPMYGYEGSFSFGKEFFEKRVAVLTQDFLLAQADAQHKKRAVDNAIDKKQFFLLAGLVSAYQVAVQNCGTVAGALAEAERYVTFGDRSADRGGFEFAAAKSQRDGEERRIQMFTKVGLIEYLGNVYKQLASPLAAANFKAHIEEYGRLSEEYGAHLGMYQENISYIQKYDAMVQANGGLKQSQRSEAAESV
jgi:hypothetical protein